MIVVAIVLGVSFAACGDDNDDEPDGGEDVTSGSSAEPLVGLWYGGSEYYRFNSDGSGFMGAEDSSGRGADWFVQYRLTSMGRGIYILEVWWKGDRDWEEEAWVKFDSHSSGVVYFDHGYGSGWVELHKL